MSVGTHVYVPWSGYGTTDSDGHYVREKLNKTATYFWCRTHGAQKLYSNLKLNLVATNTSAKQMYDEGRINFSLEFCIHHFNCINIHILNPRLRNQYFWRGKTINSVYQVRFAAHIELVICN